MQEKAKANGSIKRPSYDVGSYYRFGQIPILSVRSNRNPYKLRLRRRILPARPRTLAIRLFTFPTRDGAAPDELR